MLHPILCNFKQWSESVTTRRDKNRDQLCFHRGGVNTSSNSRKCQPPRLLNFSRYFMFFYFKSAFTRCGGSGQHFQRETNYIWHPWFVNHVMSHKTNHQYIRQLVREKRSNALLRSRFWRRAMHFSIASDLNNSVVSCCYGPTIEVNKFFHRPRPFECFISLRSYANVQHFDTSCIQTGTQRRDFDILHVPF